jgi:hypothetical protein
MQEKRGFVALLDVLGFSELISREGHAEEMERYIESLRTATDGADVEVVLFSDTIVITSPGDSAGDLARLLRPCSLALGLLLKGTIPVRGAVAHGSFTRYSSGGRGVFLAGRAVIDAFNFEKKQDWVGIMLAPSVLIAVPELEDLCAPPGSVPTKEQFDAVRQRLCWLLLVQQCNCIPFQPVHPLEPNPYQGFAVVPKDMEITDPQGMIENIKRMQSALRRLKSLAPDPKSQKKYDYTMGWLGTTNDVWNLLAHLCRFFGDNPQ